MANSTTNLDTISSNQASKEVTANAMFDAASPATLYGRRASTTSALTWGYYGGSIMVDGVLTQISNGTVALSASTTNYVEATRAGAVSKNTTAFTAGQIPLYTIVTGSATITSYTDYRLLDAGWITQNVSVAVTTADVTLSAAQARARYITTTGTLTANRAVILPNYGEWAVYCNNAGAYTTTFKTSAGTGVVIAQGDRSYLIADGTNVVLAGGAGSGTGDVVGPASATDNAIARFDGTTGKLVQNSAVTIDDSGNIVIPGNTTLGDAVGDTVTVNAGTMSIPNGLAISNGNVTISSPALLGYGTGAGGTVTQTTSKSTDVTLNKPCGRITMMNDAILADGVAGFGCNNSLVSGSDTVILSHYDQGLPYNYVFNTRTYAGGFAVYVKNISSGSLSDGIVLNFAVIKGATS